MKNKNPCCPICGYEQKPPFWGFCPLCGYTFPENWEKVATNALVKRSHKGKKGGK